MPIYQHLSSTGFIPAANHLGAGSIAGQKRVYQDQSGGITPLCRLSGRNRMKRPEKIARKASLCVGAFQEVVVETF